MPKLRASTPADKKEAAQRAKQRQASIDLAWQFRDENRDLDLAPHGMAVWFNPSGSLDGTLSMTVQIPEGLTRADYRAAWTTIKAWRERLTKRTGPGKPGGRKWLYSELVRLKKNHSYAQIAYLMNERIFRYLTYIHDARRASKTDTVNTSHLLIVSYLSALHVRQKDLHPDAPAARLSIATLSEWYKQAFASMDAGRPPFLLEDGPITEGHVRERIRQFRLSSR